MRPAPPRIESLALPEIDLDGAIAESLGRLSTRSQFFVAGARSVGLGATVLGLLPSGARAATHDPDIAILNFALVLEYLQAAFYTEAERVGALSGGLAEQARVVGAHERAHVRAFRAVLGSAAVRAPRFDFHGVTDSAGSFRSTAVAFEDLAVAAYKEQLPRIRSRRYLATAVSIHSVEARHAAWIRRLAGIVPAPNAFDKPIPDRETVDIINSTDFVTLKVPRTSSDRAPSFTG